MKNYVKPISEFLNESKKTKSRVAKVHLNSGMGDYFAIIEFEGEDTYVKEKKTLRKTWQDIYDRAMKMGATRLYSVEDEMYLTQKHISEFSDEPTYED